MTPFTQSVVAFTRRHDLFNEGARVLVALSGGPDSCALLLSLVEAAQAGALPRPVAAAHFHHGVRGTDADLDAAFCATLCARIGLPCIIGLGAVPRVNGGYSSAVARDLRYAFLREAAEDCDADVLATAHTRNDQAETVLGRVLRGTSVDGIAGIPVKRALSNRLTVVRPILSQQRSEIEAFCAAEGITPRHDPSNDKPRYTRTRLRRLLPELAQSFNPQVYTALYRLAENAAADSDFLTRLAVELWENAIQTESPEELTFDRVVVMTAPAPLRRRLLLRAIRRMTGEAAEESSTAQWVERVEKLTANGGAIDLPGSVRVSSSQTVLTFRSGAEGPASRTYEIALPIPGRADAPWPGAIIETTIVQGNWASHKRDRRSPVVEIALDWERLRQSSLVLRNTSTGERIAPLGMDGRTRLIRDMLAEAKVPLARRQEYPVIAWADTHEILWLVGIAQAESTRITAKTERSLRIESRFPAIDTNSVRGVFEQPATDL